MVKYLEAVERMHIKKEKMKNILQFYGLKVTEEDVSYYMKNVHQFMLLPQFINSFANGVKAPWMITNPEASKFGQEICQKVRGWIENRAQCR